MEKTDILAADEMTSILRIREHAEKKFREAELETLPFPHLILSDFFPPEVFAKILEYNLFRRNAGSEWVSRRKLAMMRTSTPYDHRRQINFHAGDDFEAGQEERRFWRMISDCFLSDDWFVSLICRTFPDYFHIRFGELSPADNLDHFRRQLFLQRHDPGYYIGPHTDIPGRVFTCLFAFADRPGYEEYGTQLLRPRDPLQRCWGNDHYGFEGFEVAKTAPYAPNGFLLFFKTRQSFHAVKTIPEDIPSQRYGMQFQLCEKHGGTFLEMSKPDLYANSHKTAAGRLASRFKRLVRGA